MLCAVLSPEASERLPWTEGGRTGAAPLEGEHVSNDDAYGQPHGQQHQGPAAPGPHHGYGTGGGAWPGAVQPYGGQVQPVAPHGYGPGLTVFPQPYKDTTAAWLLWFFLGHWGGHDFYLRRTGSAVGKIVLTGIGVTTVWFLLGVPFLLAVFVWWVVDAATMSGRLQQVNARVYAHNRAIGAAH